MQQSIALFLIILLVAIFQFSMESIFTLIIVPAIFALFVIILGINFNSMMNFKWFIDYFIAKDDICNNYRWTKFECETFRYGMAHFLYDDELKTYENLEQDFNITYGFILVAIILIISVLIVFNTGIINNKYKQAKNSFRDFGSKSSKYWRKLFSPANVEIPLEYFQKSIQVASVSQNLPMDDSSAASSSSLTTTSQSTTTPQPIYTTSVKIALWVLIILAILYYVLISKYLDTLLYLKTADADIKRYYSVYKILNAFILISDLKHQITPMSHPKLNDLQQTFDQILERNIASYENTSVSSEIKRIKLSAYEKLDFLKYFVFDPMSPYFLQYFKNTYIRLYIAKDPATNPDGSPYENIYLEDIYNTKLTQPDKYNEINRKVKNILEKASQKNIDVDKDDYIRFYLENRDILMDDTKMTKMMQFSYDHSTYVYYYFVFFTICFLILSHIIYVSIPTPTYILLILGMIIFYIIFVFVYTKVSFARI